jgi:hypothetical protein
MMEEAAYSKFCHVIKFSQWEKKFTSVIRLNWRVLLQKDSSYTAAGRLLEKCISTLIRIG